MKIKKRNFILFTIIIIMAMAVGISYATFNYTFWSFALGSVCSSISMMALFIFFLENRDRIKSTRAVMIMLIFVLSLIGLLTKKEKNENFISQEEMRVLVENGDAIIAKKGLVVVKNDLAYKLLHTKTHRSYSKWGDRENKIFEYKLIYSKSKTLKKITIIDAIILSLMACFIEIVRKESGLGLGVRI